MALSVLTSSEDICGKSININSAEYVKMLTEYSHQSYGKSIGTAPGLGCSKIEQPSTHPILTIPVMKEVFPEKSDFA